MSDQELPDPETIPLPDEIPVPDEIPLPPDEEGFDQDTAVNEPGITTESNKRHAPDDDEALTNNNHDNYRTSSHLQQNKRARRDAINGTMHRNGRQPTSLVLTDNLKNEQDLMARVMGFSNFDTTKGKMVPGNQSVGAVHVVKKRRYRQYMNRKGGFNRPLDKVP